MSSILYMGNFVSPLQGERVRERGRKIFHFRRDVRSARLRSSVEYASTRRPTGSSLQMKIKKCVTLRTLEWACFETRSCAPQHDIVYGGAMDSSRLTMTHFYYFFLIICPSFVSFTVNPLPSISPRRRSLSAKFFDARALSRAIFNCSISSGIFSSSASKQPKV